MSVFTFICTFLYNKGKKVLKNAVVRQKMYIFAKFHIIMKVN